MEKISLLAPTIKELIASDKETLRKTLQDIHPADIAEVIPSLKEQQQLELFLLLEKNKAREVFEKLDEEEEILLLEHLDKNKSIQLLKHMAPDEKADLFEELPKDLVNKLLRLMAPEKREELKQLLAYPEDTAGAIMTTEYVALPSYLTTSETLDKIREIAPRKETIYFVYIIDSADRLKGFVSLKNIVLSDKNKKLKEIMKTNVISVNTRDDQEEVAHIIQKYDLLVIPVVDSKNTLKGIITVDDIMDVVEKENTEDIYKMASIENLEENYFDTSFVTLAKKRGLWLAILLFTYTISTSLLRHYSPTIEMLVALAYFIPMLTGSGGNAGTQTSTLIIRGLAIGEIKFNQILKILRREIPMGLILGLLLGSLGYIRAMIMQRDPTLSIIVGIALVFTIIAATLTGSLLPLILRKLKLDPAIATGPFLTTIVDVTALIIYFEIARFLLAV